MIYSCPHCGTSFDLDPSQAKQVTKCTVCQGTFETQIDEVASSRIAPPPIVVQVAPQELVNEQIIDHPYQQFFILAFKGVIVTIGAFVLIFFLCWLLVEIYRRPAKKEFLPPDQMDAMFEEHYDQQRLSEEDENWAD